MENLTPQVSIIIPAYNQAVYLEVAIKSALSQTYQNYEIIVVDDGSTDNTPQVAGLFGHNIRYIHQANQGLAGARNTGIKNANGRFIALLDSDDEWQPKYLEKMVGLSSQFPEGTVYYCQARCIDVDGHDLPRVLGGSNKPPDKIYQTLLRSNFLIPSTILFKRSTVVEVGLFDQSLRSCEDWDLWLRLLPKHKFIGTLDCLVRYRLHGTSLSTDLDGMHNAARATIEKNFGIENGNNKNWPVEKKRAYGGLYRYKALTLVQRLENWQAAAQQLSQGLRSDPTLAQDLDLFYDFALGTQPVGLRGTAQQLELLNNAKHIDEMLWQIFDSQSVPEMDQLRRVTFGTAYYALGLVAYNTGKPNLCRKYLFKTLSYRPALLYDFRLMGDLVKSNMNPAWIEKIRRIRSAGFTYFKKINNKPKA